MNLAERGKNEKYKGKREEDKSTAQRTYLKPEEKMGVVYSELVQKRSA